MHALYIFMTSLENAKAKKENPVLTEIEIIKPSFDEIGIRIKQENQNALEKATKQLDSIQKKSAGRSSANSGSYAGELQKARNLRDSILKDIEHTPILIEFRELMAKIEWQKSVMIELEAKRVEIQAELDKQKKDFALLEKYGYIKAKIKT